MIINLGSLYPKQKEFCKATTKYIAYGGARGGGKSHASRQKAILLALNYPGIQILLLRRTLNELRENHVIPLLKKLNNLAVYKDVTKEFIFPNTSRIKLGYCDTEKDVLQYQGQSYDIIIMEEATQFTEFQFQCLTECNRLSGQCPTFMTPRMYFTCNPGGVGHTWVKRIFIDRDYKATEDEKDYTFIKSLVYDNDFLMENDPGYVKTLENLPEDRKKAMLYGDWNIFDGMYFNEFRSDIHTIEPFEIPNTWNKYITMDYGLDMLAVLWIAVDTHDNAYVYKELYESGLIISEASKRILEVNGNDKVICRYAPPDLWQTKSNTGENSFEVFKNNGVDITRSNNNRIQGWYAVKEFLKVIDSKDTHTGQPIKTSKMKIFKNCRNLIRTLPQLQYDDKNPNDVSNNPHELTHINDALRGFCIERLKTPIIQTEHEQIKLHKYEEVVSAIAGNYPDDSFFNY
jgi:phage terminase large subunit